MRTFCSLFAGVSLLGCAGDIGDTSGGPDASTERGIDAARSIDAGDGIDAPLQPAACAATDGDTQFSDPTTGHCYFWFNTPVMRDQAMATCQDFGAHLATITSAAENSAVANVAPDALPDPDVNSSIDSWLGGNDLANEMTHVWDTGEPFVFDAWRDGEPNDSNPNDPNGEDCIVFEGDTDQWDDRSCALTPVRFICEREP
jgi:hypothetical protein